MKSALVATFTILLLFLSQGNLLGNEIILSGSTTVQKRILEPTKEMVEKAVGVKIKVRGISTGKGFEELKTGKANAAIASSPMASILKKAGIPDDGAYIEHVIIRDTIVPIVNNKNSVAKLTFTQLSDINTGKITNWSEVGGADQKIVVITSSKTSATRAVFQKIVMKKAAYRKGVREVRSTREEVTLVSKFKGGIGAVSEAFVKMNPGKVKTVQTKEISRPLSIITKGEPSKELKNIIELLKTPEMKKLFK